MVLLMEVYSHYRHNHDLLQTVRKQLPVDSTAGRLVGEASRLDLRQFPLLCSLEENAE